MKQKNKRPTPEEEKAMFCPKCNLMYPLTTFPHFPGTCQCKPRKYQSPRQ